MEFHPKQYRLRFLTALFRALILPQLILSVVLRYTNFHIPYTPSFIIHILFVPLYGYAKTYLSSYRNASLAKSLGASEIPCIKGKWPGNIDILVRMVKGVKSGYLMQVPRDLFEEYECKTFNTRVLWQDQIMTMDESVVKFMFTPPNFESFGKGYYWSERMETFLGDGIFNRDGEQWKLHRSIARPYFAKDRITDFEIFDKHASSTLDIISSHVESREALDIQDLLARFTLDSATEFLFGQCVHSLAKPLPKAGLAKIGPKGSMMENEDFMSFAKAFEECQVQITVRTRIDKNWPILEMFQDKTKAPSDVIHKYIAPIVDHAVKAKEEAKATGITTNDENTFLGHLANSTDDKDLIRNQVVNMLVAGRDTTAALLTFALYFLAIHPEVRIRLRSEVLKTCGDSRQLPTYESIRGMKYLRAVLQETLRLFPPVPVNSRSPLFGQSAVVPNFGETKQKLFIPSGASVIYFMIWLQRRKDLWGDDADAFDPERWLDPEKVKKVVDNPFMFVPFHAGPRICLGQNFALNEASFFIIRLLQRFESWELAKDAQPAGSTPPESWKMKKNAGRQAIEECCPGTSFTAFVKGGLWMRFKL